MRNQSRFAMQNDGSKAITVNIEPECTHFMLRAGETLIVRDAYETDPVNLKVESENGDTVISIWPGDGDLKVEKNGVDVFDLIHKSSATPLKAVEPPRLLPEPPRAATSRSKT